MAEKEKKLPELTPETLALLEDLKEINEPMIVAEMKVRGLKANPSQLNALVKRGLVEAVEVEIEVPTVIKRKVQRYTVK